VVLNEDGARFQILARIIAAMRPGAARSARGRRRHHRRLRPWTARPAWAILRAMHRRLAATLVAGAFLAAGCQEGSTPTRGNASGPQPSRDDIDMICNARQRSGADQQDEASALYTMAMWLQSNVVSEEGHAFLIAFARLGDDRAARRDMLQAAADRVRLPSCPLIEDWR